ncbi:MAG: hypothetical protein NUV70_07145 [Caldiserica bacterium]|nr:hypothetical protein [Caldisericota bacterium]
MLKEGASAFLRVLMGCLKRRRKFPFRRFRGLADADPAGPLKKALKTRLLGALRKMFHISLG